MVARKSATIALIDEINALELQADKDEAKASELRWCQAGRVVEMLEAGWTQRKLAEQWMRANGTTYSRQHVQWVVKTWAAFCHLSGTDRPRWNEAYNSDEVRKPKREPEPEPQPEPPPEIEDDEDEDDEVESCLNDDIDVLPCYGKGFVCEVNQRLTEGLRLLPELGAETHALIRQDLMETTRIIRSIRRQLIKENST